MFLVLSMGLMFLLFLPPQPKPWPYCTARYAGTMGIKRKLDRLPSNSLSISVHTAASTVHLLPYSAKLSREKTFTNFAVLELPAKVFSMKFGHTIPTYDRL